MKEFFEKAAHPSSVGLSDGVFLAVLTLDLSPRFAGLAPHEVIPANGLLGLDGSLDIWWVFVDGNGLLIEPVVEAGDESFLEFRAGVVVGEVGFKVVHSFLSYFVSSLATASDDVGGVFIGM